MSGVSLVKNVGDLSPVFAASSAFRLAVNPPAGILKGLQIRNRGQHTTDITTAATDGELNYFNTLQVTVNRKGKPPIIQNALPRDHKWLTAYFRGTLPERANPATAGTALANAHYGQFDIPFAPPDRLCNDPDDWGIPTDTLDGPIIIEGTYGAASDIGAGATAIANRTSVSCDIKVGSARRPRMALGVNYHRLAHESDSRLGPDSIGVGNLEALAAVMLVQHDNSAAAAQRVDGLITRFTVELQEYGIISDELFRLMKARTQSYYGLAVADVPAGVGILTLAPGWSPDEMPMLRGRTLSVIHDSAEATPDDITAVTPTTSDAVRVLVVGAQAA